MSAVLRHPIFWLTIVCLGGPQLALIVAPDDLWKFVAVEAAISAAYVLGYFIGYHREPVPSARTTT